MESASRSRWLRFILKPAGRIRFVFTCNTSAIQYLQTNYTPAEKFQSGIEKSCHGISYTPVKFDSFIQEPARLWNSNHLSHLNCKNFSKP